MRPVHAHRRLAAWMAALAMLLASLAPSLSHALAPAAGLSWIEICSAQGPVRIGDRSDGSPSQPDASHVFQHCPLCSVHAATLGLPPPAPSAPWPVEGHGEFAPVFHAAQPSLLAWARAQPRGPPQLS